MDSIRYFRQLFDYDHWGNQAALASLSSIDGTIDVFYVRQKSN